MTHTVESLMALHDEVVSRSKLTEEGEAEARSRFLAALTETLAPTFQPDWADFENGRECGRLEAAQPNTQNYPEKDIPQPEQTESSECDCGRIHKKTRYGWASNEAAQPVPPHECKTDAEKLAYAAGWWKALEANRAQPVREPIDSLGIPKSCGKPRCSPTNHHE